MNLLVLGAGRMGRAIVFDCIAQPDIGKVVVADVDSGRIEASIGDFDDDKITTAIIDVTDSNAVAALMAGNNVVVSAVPFIYNISLAAIAVDVGCNFCDLGGNTEVVREELNLHDAAVERGVTVIPDCGLAPGLANVIAAHLIETLDDVESVGIRVGGLPRNPVPPLNYMQVFSVRGLINEYLGEAEILQDGVMKKVPTLEGVERLNFGGEFSDMEAFYTLGGVSTLAESYAGKVKNLDYKTIRYSGHRDIIKGMLDAGFASETPIMVGDTEVVPRELLIKLLEENLPVEGDDVTLLRVTAVSIENGEEIVTEYNLIDKPDKVSGLSSMMRTTGFPAAIVAQMLGRGETKHPGAFPQEFGVPYEKFIAELDKRGIKFEIRRRAADE